MWNNYNNYNNYNNCSTGLNGMITNKLYVQNIREAENYPCPPNSDIVFFTKENGEDICCRKVTAQNGQTQMYYYDITERKQIINTDNNYVSKEEFNTFSSAMMNKLEEITNSLKENKGE